MVDTSRVGVVGGGAAAASLRRTTRCASRHSRSTAPRCTRTAAACLALLAWTTTAAVVIERGVRLDTGAAFYRAESAVSRDLAVLGAAVHSETRLGGVPLRVLDAFGGCGSRGARYLERSVASFVHCNEGSEELGEVIRANLSPYGTEGEAFAVSHEDAHALLLRNYGTYGFDLIDVDSFGLSARAIAAALWAAKRGGLLYLTSTDGRAHTAPERTLATYGSWPLDSSPTHAAVNEQALRLLIGYAVQQAATHGLRARPLFSLFSAHGPCMRTMLSIERGPPKLPQLLTADYGFIATCDSCGQHTALGWTELTAASCPNCGETGERLRLAGPLYTGPLHDARALARMGELAEEWGVEYEPAGALLARLAAEGAVEGEGSDAILFYDTHALARRAGLRGPVSLSALEEALRNQGYSTSRTHCHRRGLKTNAPVAAQVAAARAVAGGLDGGLGLGDAVADVGAVADGGLAALADARSELDSIP
ncbi:S-adenosyl-L-methionine-dependent methyltransferase [Pavlovales sp. CCMP2436]|nr:S-adenosyl-L-methionine-dependent methyltransferase [Pavlovales sp. CCMP2436]|mmetsp:Transcript_33786/g.79492  ORF Transcript_33786/g.79492 Transcript_33786/m.79492 type:complete len:481 (-) Transcript_33786:145-1587(-)